MTIAEIETIYKVMNNCGIEMNVADTDLYITTHGEKWTYTECIEDFTEKTMYQVLHEIMMSDAVATLLKEMEMTKTAINANQEN